MIVNEESMRAIRLRLRSSDLTTVSVPCTNLRHVHVRLTDKGLFLVAASSRYILVIATDGKSEAEKTIKAI